MRGLYVFFLEGLERRGSGVSGFSAGFRGVGIQLRGLGVWST